MTIIEWFAALKWIHVLLIVTTLLVFVGYIYLLVKVTRLEFVGGLVGKRKIRYLGILFGFLVVVYLFYNLYNIQPNGWVEISLLAGLVAATGALALVTLQQADASIKEMRAQRITASRPVIIQKAVHDDRSSHFEIYNTGNGPAMEVEVSLLLQREPPYKPHNCQREGFLRAGDTPIPFYTTFPSDVANSTFYVVSEYQGIPSHSPQPTWYQTWLPCKLSISGKVISGKLEFHDDVSEENRIGIFKSEFSNRSKPK